jgi:hypothetical protein
MIFQGIGGRRASLIAESPFPTMNPEDRPSGAFLISATGFAFHVAAFAILIILVAIPTLFWNGNAIWMGGPPWPSMAGWVLLWLASAVVVVVMGLLGVLMMNSPSVSRVRAGSVIVLLVAIIAFPTLWGLFIGSLLMFIGAILGLVWEPQRLPGPPIP